MSIIALGLAEFSIPETLQFAKTVHSSLTNNPYVPEPDPTLAALLALITKAETANDAYEAEKKVLHTKMLARDEAVAALQDALRDEASAVQKATKGVAAEIETTGFRVKREPSPAGTPAQVQGLVVTANGMERVLNLRWKALNGVVDYEIESSPDPFTETSWSYRGSVTKAQAAVPGDVRGVKLWLRVRAKSTAGPGPWSEPVGKVVP